MPTYSDEARPTHDRNRRTQPSAPGPWPHAGDRPRCSDPITRELWTAEHAAHRAIAVKCCRGCRVLVLCGQAAEERDERFGVWGGVDRAARPGRNNHSTNLTRTKQQRN